MSIVKEIIELHGGSIEISSELARGTHVRLWLPIAKEAATEQKRLDVLAKMLSGWTFPTPHSRTSG
jgi:hypothetical protein